MAVLLFLSGTLLYAQNFDQFEGRLPPGWRVVEGKARVEGGMLHITSSKQNPRVVFERPFGGNILVSARFLGAPNCHWTGLVVKGAYWLTVNRQYRALFLDRRPSFVPSGVPVERTGKNLGSLQGYERLLWRPDDFRLALAYKGRKLYAFLDGKLVLEAEDERPVGEGPLALVGGWGTDVWVDDIEVRRVPSDWKPPKPPPAPKPSLPDLKVWLDRKDAIYHDGERPTLFLEWRAEGAAPPRIEVSLLDFYEREVWRKGDVRVKVDAGRAKASVEIPPPGRGIFKVRLFVVLPSGRRIPQGDIVSFSVIPRRLYERPALEESPFGGHPHWELPEFHYALARKIGMRWARDHDAIQYTWWDVVQPERDVWRWFDREVGLLRENNLHLLGEFLAVPRWASSAPPSADRRVVRASMPKDLKDFARYVYEVVRHYRGRVRHYEVWNEPHYSGFFRGKPEDYVRLLKTAYQAAKSADSDCIIIGGGGISLQALDWVERAIRAGSLKFCDAFSFHYGYSGKPVEDYVLRFERNLSELRRLMRRYGEEKPLWNTEAAVYTTSFLDPLREGFSEPDAHYHFREAAYKFVRMFVVNLANGVRKVFYYDLVWPRPERFPDWSRRNPVNTRMLEEHGGLKPIGVAYATLADLLEEARFLAKIELAPSVRAYIFEGRDFCLAVYWGNFGRRGRKGEILLPAVRGSWWLGDVMNVWRKLSPSEEGGLPLPLSRAPKFVKARGIEARDFLSVWRKASVRLAKGVKTRQPFPS